MSLQQKFQNFDLFMRAFNTNQNFIIIQFHIIMTNKIKVKIRLECLMKLPHLLHTLMMDMIQRFHIGLLILLILMNQPSLINPFNKLKMIYPI